MLISRGNLAASLALVVTLWAVTGQEAAAQEEVEQETAAGLSRTPVEGREGGRKFDDISEILEELSDTSRVQQVVIHHSVHDDNEVIYGIQMIHDEDELELNGRSDGKKRGVFDLDNKAAKYITGISGTYTEEWGIQSLSIHYAQDGKYEQMSDRYGAFPFFEHNPSAYFLKCDLGEEVVGFRGRAGKWIDAIGLICRRRDE